MTPISIVEAPMKKSVLPGGALAFSLTACSGGTSDADSSSSAGQSASQSAGSTTGGDAAAPTDTASASGTSSSAAAAGPTKVGGSDQQICKAVVSFAKTSGDDLDDAASDQEAMAKVDQNVAQFRSFADEFKDAGLKADTLVFADFYQRIVDAARTGQTSDADEKKIEDEFETKATKAADELKSCANG